MEGEKSLMERTIRTESMWGKKGYLDFCILNVNESTCMRYLNASVPITTKMKNQCDS